MTKVLWFSRHEMDADQRGALETKFGGPVDVTQVNGTMPNVHVPFKGEIDGIEGIDGNIPAFKTLIQDFDVVAIVAPINLQQQILGIAGDKPVIMCENAREFVEGDKVVFRFVRWFRLVKIEVVTEDFAA